MIAVTMGRARPFKPHLPLGMMKMAIPLLQKIPPFPITMDQLQMLLEESIGGDEWQKTFGFKPRGLQDGIAAYLSKT
jgi:NADH dehydrogenase